MWLDDVFQHIHTFSYMYGIKLLNGMYRDNCYMLVENVE